MSDRDYLYGHVCAHGSLARSCQVCDLEDEVCDLEDEVRRLRDGYADLVDAARDVCTPVRPSEAVEARLRACLARIDCRDPLDVFTGGGA